MYSGGGATPISHGRPLSLGEDDACESLEADGDSYWWLTDAAAVPALLR